MKTKLLFSALVFWSSMLPAQTDGWFLYNKPGKVSVIVPDDSTANILHLATDMGYIQYNTSTSLVTDYLNLTSQNPGIANVNGIDVNPTNNDIALALDGGFAIYDGTTVTVYNYDNSALTVGSVGGSQFTKLKVRYGRLGQLYIFKPDITGYQIFNAGVFNTEVPTAFRPQDIVENQAGTKVYFAGWNDGLHEYTKATNSWINYTTSNSDLIYNPLLSLQVDSSDLLYIGSFQGLNTMTSGGVWNTYQQLIPPGNVFYFPVYDISVNETSGDLLIRTSEPNTNYNGLTVLTLGTNSWTNYTNDATNCLNENVFNTAVFGGDGEIYTSKNSFSVSGELFKFVHNTDTCSQLDINYLNAPISTTSNFISGITTRTGPSGVIDIGFTSSDKLHILPIDPNTFDGTPPPVTTITPSSGNASYSLLSDNDYFIVETNNGWVFVDGSNSTTEFTHSLPDYLALSTQKASALNSTNGIVNLVHRGFDASWNYRAYKTQCNTGTGTCTAPEEVFTDDRDVSQNIFINCLTNSSGEVTCAAIKKASPSNRVNPNSLGGNDAIEAITWNGITNSAPINLFDRVVPFTPDPIIGVPLILPDENNDPNFVVPEFPLNDTYKLAYWQAGSSSPIFQTIDVNNDGQSDRLVTTTTQEITQGRTNTLGTIQLLGAGPSAEYFVNENLSFHTQVGIVFSILNEDDSGTFSNGVLIPDLDVGDLVGAPGSFFYFSRHSQNAPVELLIAMVTNRGIIFKVGIEVSSNLLSLDNSYLKANNLLLYPNPSNDHVSFSNNHISSVAVFDINGRKVLEKTGNSFSVKTLAKGVYIVNGQTKENQTISKKLVVN